MVFAKKSLGQNFLMHRQTAERIVKAAELPEGASVVEVGPGTGMLTNELLSAGLTVLAIEADHTLIDGLEERFEAEVKQGRLQIVHADIRSFDMDALPAPYHVVANIPYYITGEIIRQFLTAANQPRSMTLLVQKEVAERIARAKKESLLSLSVKVYGVPAYAFTVPRGAFVPAPNVDSAVLRIADIARKSFASSDEERDFFILVRTGFAHKRKRLAKNLEERYEKEHIALAFSETALGENARAEDLSRESWVRLNRAMKPSSEQSR